MKMTKQSPTGAGWYWWTEKPEYPPVIYEVDEDLEFEVFHDHYVKISSVGGWWGKVNVPNFEFCNDE